MGAACCIAAKERTMNSGSPTVIHRHSHYSPSWSFRWDNRGRVVGEETTVDWFRNEGRDDDRMEVKSGTTAEATLASDEGSSPLDSFRSLALHKFPAETPDPVAPRCLEEVKDSAPCVSSMAASLPSQSHSLPTNAANSRGHHRSPAQQFLRQASDSRIFEYRSPTFSISEEPPAFLPHVWGTESTQGSHGGSSDGFSIPAFSEFTARERWSFDSDDRSSLDFQTCGICSKLLTESCQWSRSSQKIMAFNEIAVVSVLTCGHVYHGDCLEYMTPEISKYDPVCPVCTFGEKRAAKMAENALRGELELMAKRSRKRVVLNEPSSFDHGRRPSSRSSSSSGKPFMKRHFSFGTGKSLFWAKSSKF